MKYIYSISTHIVSGKINLKRLKIEISESNILTSLESIGLEGDDLSIDFISELSVEDKTTLDSLVSAHSGDPIPEEVVPQKVTVNAQPAFADKILPDGRSLFRRKHGIRQEVPARIDVNTPSVTAIRFSVPYVAAKIDEVEIVNCTAQDTVDLKVLDSETGAYTTIPNYLLNQFGFDVNLSDIYYTDTSNYDAELNLGMQIEVTYKNYEADIKQIGVNFVLHEAKET